MVSIFKFSEILDDKINMSIDIRKLNNKEDFKHKKNFGKKSDIKEEPKKENNPNAINDKNNTKGHKKDKEGGCHCLII
jgi:hypothetical protein